MGLHALNDYRHDRWRRSSAPCPRHVGGRKAQYWEHGVQDYNLKAVFAAIDERYQRGAYLEDEFGIDKESWAAGLLPGVGAAARRVPRTQAFARGHAGDAGDAERLGIARNDDPPRSSPHTLR